MRLLIIQVGFPLFQLYYTSNLCSITAGAKTGSISGQPPPVSSEATTALLKAAQNDPIGQNTGGQQDDGGKEGEKKVKSEKECMDPEQ